MKREIYFTITILAFVFVPVTIFSQSVYVIEATNFEFTPKNITVEIGDTVRWKNVEGNHNVVADDGSFTSGSASTSSWVYDHVFTSAGENPYYCVNHGSAGGNGMAGNVTVEVPTGVAKQNGLINNFKLEQNYPNPFNPNTKINWQSPAGGRQTLKIFDVVGNEIATLIDEVKPAGNYDIEFDASSLSSGVYFYRLNAGAYIQTKKMLLIK